jgi:hypothetical protein
MQEMGYKTKILLTFNHNYMLYNIFILFLVFTFVIMLIVKISKKYNYISGNYLFILLCYHTIMSLILYRLSLYGIADWRGYYIVTASLSRKEIAEVYGYGVHFMYFIIYPFIHYAKMTYLSLTILFSIFGYLGLFFLYIGLAEVVKESKIGLRCLQMACFLPGLSYWSGFIGKDPLVFLCINVILYSILKIHTRFILFLIAIAVMTLIRPYIGVIILFSLLLSLMLTKKIKIIYKILALIFVIGITIVSINIFLQTYGLEDFTYKQGDKLISSSQGDWGGGSDVDISELNIVLKIFTFLFRPLFFDAHSITAVLSSIENLIYLIIVMTMVSPAFISFLRKNEDFYVKFNFFLFLLGLILLAQTNANLGTIVRKKIMIAPSLISIFIPYIVYRKSKIQTKEKIRRQGGN